MYPGLGKLEMFSRNKRDGWTMWGNQAGDKLAA
jgi:N6-adenosine-specific RNA methylase IME4